VEPFAGGAAVFFAKPKPDVSNTSLYREVLNDVSNDVANLYRCFQDPDKCERLIRRLEFTPYSRDEHALRREIVADEVEKAARYYVDVQMSFSNQLGRGWCTAVAGRNHAATFAKRVSGLAEYISRMSGVYIEHRDALEVIKQWDSPQTFFYCDPPYPGADQGHYKGYTLDDFKRLVSVLDNCEGSFLLSNYAQDVDTPSDWHIHVFSASSSAAKLQADKSRKEIVWSRGNKTQVRKEIQMLYDSGKFDCFTAQMPPVEDASWLGL
jgi:DNA adenine methylase